nr:hypothetical protein [Dankookia rubra]
MSQRRALARRAAFADAVVEVSGPGRSAAKRRMNVTWPPMPSSCSRSSAGAPTTMDLIVCIALGPRLDRGVARDPDVADHLDGAGAGLRFRRRLACEDGARRGLRVEHVVLAVAPAGTAVRAVDLEDTMPGLSERAGEAGAVGSGAFDAEGLYRAEGPGPCGEAAVSGAARRNRCGGEPGAQGAEGDRRMDVLVGVDADDDVCGW